MGPRGPCEASRIGVRRVVEGTSHDRRENRSFFGPRSTAIGVDTPSVGAKLKIFEVTLSSSAKNVSYLRVIFDIKCVINNNETLFHAQLSFYAIGVDNKTSFKVTLACILHSTEKETLMLFIILTLK